MKFSIVFYISVICILLNIELEFSAKRRCDSFLNKAQNLLTAIELNIILKIFSGMESEEVMTASVTSNSSDNESWTIIEEDREDPLAQARIDVIQAVAEFTIKRDQDPKEDSGESDIERIADEEAETNLESLTSDGIPVGDELSSNGDQYLWSSDHETELTSSTASTITKLDSLCPSGYPPEELMDGFSEIEKLRIYLHTPNKTLSLYLTGTLIIVFSLVCGLGVGHFLGNQFLLLISFGITLP